MPTHVLTISQGDLRPLVADPSSMHGAIAALEQATLDFHHGKVREHNLADQTQGASTDSSMIGVSLARVDLSERDDPLLCLGDPVRNRVARLLGRLLVERIVFPG